MDKTLDYLSEYLVEPKVLLALRANDPLVSELPEWWQSVLLSEGSDRIQRTLQAWENYRWQLPAVFEFMSKHLRSVNLLTDQNRVTGGMSIRLLYELENGEETMYYAGGTRFVRLWLL